MGEEIKTDSVNESRETARARRMFERAALKSMQAAQRERYAAEDAEDQAVEDRLRHERNEANDRMRAREWDLAVQRELAAVDTRAAYNEARGVTAERKRDFQQASREAHATYDPQIAELKARIRHDRLEASERWREEDAARTSQDLDGLIERHADWDASRERAVAAKRALHAGTPEHKAALKAQRAERKAVEDRERTERNAAEEKRAEHLTWLAKEAAVAEAFWRDAVRSGADEAQVERLRTRADELSAELAQAQTQAREERNATRQQAAATRWQRDVSYCLDQADFRAEWNDARMDEKAARRAAAAADAQHAADTREETRAAQQRVQTERKDVQNGWKSELAALYAQRDAIIDAARKPYKAAQAAQREEDKAARAQIAPARAEFLAQEEAVAQEHREERLARAEEHRVILAQRAADRALARSIDRESASGSGQTAYQQMIAANETAFTPQEVQKL